MPQLAAGLNQAASFSTGTIVISLITIALVLAGVTWLYSRRMDHVGHVLMAGILVAAAGGIASTLYSWGHAAGGGLIGG